MSAETPRQRLDSTLTRAAHAPQPNPEIATMTTAKLTLQTPAETAIWASMVQRLSRSQFMESAIEDADEAVLALRERMPSAPAQPAPETLSVDAAARLHMHGMLTQARISGATVRCIFADGTVAVGVPAADPRPYNVQGAWVGIEYDVALDDEARIVKVEIL